jgi:mRNA degradation ribonuclease J1/J2
MALDELCPARAMASSAVALLHRLASVKKAADAAGRKICFMGMSLTTYLEAAWRDGRAPFDPRELVPPSDIADHNPNEVLVVCTGSQVPSATLLLGPCICC